jgi:hypothetical protein
MGAPWHVRPYDNDSVFVVQPCFFRLAKHDDPFSMQKKQLLLLNRQLFHEPCHLLQIHNEKRKRYM